jgi:hypothetical protein
MTSKQALEQMESTSHRGAERVHGGGGPGIPPIASTESQSPWMRKVIAKEAREMDAIVDETRERWGLPPLDRTSVKVPLPPRREPVHSLNHGIVARVKRRPGRPKSTEPKVLPPRVVAKVHGRYAPMLTPAETLELVALLAPYFKRYHGFRRALLVAADVGSASLHALVKGNCVTRFLGDKLRAGLAKIQAEGMLVLGVRRWVEGGLR